jgi:hypothetical protein
MRPMPPDTSSGPSASSPMAFPLPSSLPAQPPAAHAQPSTTPMPTARAPGAHCAFTHASGMHNAHCASARRAVVRSPLSSAVSTSARACPPSPLPLARQVITLYSSYNPIALYSIHLVTLYLAYTGIHPISNKYCGLHTFSLVRHITAGFALPKACRPALSQFGKPAEAVCNQLFNVISLMHNHPPPRRAVVCSWRNIYIS